ncbi:MAG TPA: hypothetical protein VGR51_04010 [Thermoplasmata archaeon]|nr:hypothetical protein [Thermoplasmata archaeon]
MREYHKALLITATCATIVLAGLVRAYVQAPKPLTTAEILAATRDAVDRAVDAAITSGGVSDSQSVVEAGITASLRRQGFGGLDAHLRRPNDLDPWAAFYFYVDVGTLRVRFDLEGTRDPLLAIRLGLDVRIHEDPYHPYGGHGDPGVLSVCLAHRYYHLAPEAPDFFARLENRTRDPYHFGLETLLSNGRELAADHSLLESGAWGLDDAHRARYGL